MKHPQSGLIESFAFDAFVACSTNKAAISASRNAVAMLGHACNPLHLYGRSGSGKSHLLHAIGNAVREMNPNLNVICVGAADYCSGVAQAYRRKSFDSFRSRYRASDLFLLDDVQLLKDKPLSQEELVSLIDVLVRNKKQVVVCGDARINLLEGISDRLVTRLNSGVVVGIDPPGPIPLRSDNRAGQSVASGKDVAKAVERSESVFTGVKRDAGRIPELLEAIHRVWLQEGSDLRLGQLLVNLISEHAAGNDLFYVDDDLLMSWIQERESKGADSRASNKGESCESD